jgi:hypothetical protein
MKKILALIAILSFATLGQAVPIVKHVSGPTAVIDPVTLVTLDAYVLSLESTDGGKITAVDLNFAGPLMQIMPYKSAPSWPKYNPTPQDQLAVDGWSADYIASDSHFLLRAVDVVFGAAVATEDLTAPPSAFRDDDLLYHGPGTYLKTGAMGLKAPVQGVTVALVRLVIAQGADPRTVTGSGDVATDVVTDPYPLPTFYIPEPATMMLLLGGSLFGLRPRRS